MEVKGAGRAGEIRVGEGGGRVLVEKVLRSSELGSLGGIRFISLFVKVVEIASGADGTGAGIEVGESVGTT